MNSQTVSRKAVRPSSAGTKLAEKSPKMANIVENWVSTDSIKNLTTNNLQTVIFVTYGLIIFGIDPIYNLRNDF